jgi:hypothetical protein
MAISSRLLKHNEYFRVRAQPLTLEEVLHLRDGMGTPKAFGLNIPYQTKILASNENILLALN